MTYQIHLSGIVQGVGFRPMVYALAVDYGLCGTVTNSSQGVVIRFNATEEQAEKFYQEVLASAPPHSVVVAHSLTPIENIRFTTFTIEDSVDEDLTRVLLSPDFAMCETCRAEMRTATNRRFLYPFITCAQCGPRYSIIQRLPYDRANTSMHTFTMCEACAKEYTDVADRRFYAQTNSCPVCGIRMRLYAGGDLLIEEGDILARAISLLREGKVVAVKGIGGYLLLCDATNPHALSLLRKRKHRPTKPFALLYPTLERIKKDASLRADEEAALQSVAAPIVLVSLKKEHTVHANLVAPGLRTVGVMLPYAPLLACLADEFEKPLVATSANVSNSPIVYTDDDALTTLAHIADAILVHNREIVIPQDDSVIRFTEANRKILLRRSRGLAPSFLTRYQSGANTMVAMGAHLKSTVALQHANQIFVSHYLGDLESANTINKHTLVTQHLLDVCKAKPAKVIRDVHPEYASTRLAEEYATKYALPVAHVQHHCAHLAAVLAENNLLDSEENVLGVVWDGSGLGIDNAIWGGEFFTYYKGNILRTKHFAYFPLLLGDKMAHEPRLAALALAGENKEMLSAFFTEQEWKIYTQLLHTEYLPTSSVGRVFDAVACVCGLSQTLSYEGEAALLLEEKARQFYRASKNYVHHYPIAFAGEQVDTQALFKAVLNDVKAKVSVEEIAFRFHLTLVKLMEAIAHQQAVQKIAFSGGVFQNALLLDLLDQHLGTAYQLFFHEQLSPNDENVSFGQLVYVNEGMRLVNEEEFLLLEQEKNKDITKDNYVFSNSR
jgi:hydrogenase maturation protein HypF